MILSETALQKGKGIDRKTAFAIAADADGEVLFTASNSIREQYRGNRVDLCSIINAKSGACPEDCSFCSHSAHSNRKAEVYPLLQKETILESALQAKNNGVRRFCIVTSGKTVSATDMDRICEFISEIRKIGMLPCATLGMLDDEQLGNLKDAGLNRYHHNLETSEAYFSEICTSHTYRDKLDTISRAQSLGLSICSGGIFGLGETWSDRIDMAYALKELDVDSVPINFFTPVQGTPLGDRGALDPLEALKIIALYRLILPDKEIRVCGGRPQTLHDLDKKIFAAGADGLLMGNYLTTTGRNPDEDLRMIRDMGLDIEWL